MDSPGPFAPPPAASPLTFAGAPGREGAAAGRPGGALRGFPGSRRGAAPARPPCAPGAASSQRRGRCRGRGLAAAEAGGARRGARGRRRRRRRESGRGTWEPGWQRRAAARAAEEVSVWRAFLGAPSAARRPGCFLLSVPPPPGVRSQGLGAGPGRHRPAHAPAAACSRSRLGPAPHLPAPEPSPRGCRDAPGSVPRRPGAERGLPPLRRPVWGDAGLSLCSSPGHARQHPKPKACVPQSRPGACLGGVMGTRAAGRAGGAAHLASPPSRHLPTRRARPPRVPTLAAVVSWQVTGSSDRAAGARVRGAPGPLLPCPPSAV